MNKTDYDFSGWATRNDIRCDDGRVILKDAFKLNDQKIVPLVWNHQHNSPNNVLGHALLVNKEDGVYAYGKFNETEQGKNAKLLVDHGDITGLSIYANQLSQNGHNVVHGNIREVSLVLAGANPGAYINFVMGHGEDGEDGVQIMNIEEESLSLSHGTVDLEEKKENGKEEPKMASEKETGRTVKDVLDTLNEEQTNVVNYLITELIKDDSDEDEEEKPMKHNAFDNDDREMIKEETLSHSDMMAIVSDAKRYGSLKDSVIAHGIEHIDYLFPEAKNITERPTWISREMGWVTDVLNGTHHSPFSRIKSMHADITAEDARARGYIKGNYKTEEVFSLLKRTTTPALIYKKQKLDREDVLDITDFDIVAWIKTEMRMMLNEEIARAILIGDGRNASSEEKISEQNIRPIWKDEDLYTIKKGIQLASNLSDDQKAKAFIRACITSRKDYKGTGNPTLFTTDDWLTMCLLMEDSTGRVIYDTEEKLRTALRVKKIVTVPVMENLTRVDGVTTKTLAGIIVNLADYNVGADKGGSVNMFDDFDIDYNAQKYLIETRCSGALTVPYSAIALETYTA